MNHWHMKQHHSLQYEDSSLIDKNNNDFLSIFSGLVGSFHF